MEAKIRKIQELKKEKNAVIMAHYYVPDEVQEKNQRIFAGFGRVL